LPAHRLLFGRAHFGGARGLGRHCHEDDQLAGARVLDRRVDAGRDQDSVHLLQLLGLRAGSDARSAFDNDVQGVRRLEAATRLGLVAFEAEQVADQARPVEQRDVHRPLPQKSPGATEVNNIHKGYLPAADEAFASANVARIFSIKWLPDARSATRRAFLNATASERPWAITTTPLIPSKLAPPYSS